MCFLSHLPSQEQENQNEKKKTDHSTLDEVCDDLKTKLMAYLNLLSEGE